MDCVAIPAEAFAVAIRRIKDVLEFLDALLRPIQPKDTLDRSRYTSRRQHHARRAASEVMHPPFSFKKTPHFATTMGT